MGEAIQTIKSANTGITGVKSLLETAKGLVESARSATGDRATLEGQYDDVMAQINQLVKDSGYKGVNFLDGTAQSLDVLFNETGTNKLTLDGFDAKVSTLVSAYTAAANFSAATALNAAAAALTAAITTLSEESSKLSSNLSVVNARLDFTNSMINNLKEGADRLTLADSNEEGANMLALQTRQQLGVTSLSLASQAAQGVLRLF
jgi:flagellin